MNRIKINDVYGIDDVFNYIDNNNLYEIFDQSILSNIFWLEYSERQISYTAYKLLNNGVLSETNKQLLGRIINNKFSKKWEKYIDVYMSEYNPIENYSMREEENGTNTVATEGKTTTDGQTIVDNDVVTTYDTTDTTKHTGTVTNTTTYNTSNTINGTDTTVDTPAIERVTHSATNTDSLTPTTTTTHKTGIDRLDMVRDMVQKSVNSAFDSIVNIDAYTGKDDTAQNNSGTDKTDNLIYTYDSGMTGTNDTSINNTTTAINSSVTNTTHTDNTTNTHNHNDTTTVDTDSNDSDTTTYDTTVAETKTDETRNTTVDETTVTQYDDSNKTVLTTVSADSKTGTDTTQTVYNDTDTITHDGDDTVATDTTTTINNVVGMENEETGTNERTLTRSGNIGVTTSQQMLQSEIDLWKWNFLDVIMLDVASVLVNNIYV